MDIHSRLYGMSTKKHNNKKSQTAMIQTFSENA